MALRGAARGALGGGAVLSVVLLATRSNFPVRLLGPPHSPAAAAAPPPHPVNLFDALEKKGGSRGCGKCVARKCYSGAKCAKQWGYADPKGLERDYCVCACCGLQCGLKRGCPVKPARPLVPEIPAAQLVANLTGSGMDALDGVRSVAFCEWRGSAYALLTSMLDDALHIANIDDPSRPALVSSLRDGERGVTLASPSGVAAVEIRGIPYALVTSFTGNALQIIRLSPPSDPNPVGSAQHGRGGFDMLRGAHSVQAETIGGHAYAFVSAYTGGGVQVVDVDSAGAPRAAALVRLDAEGPRALALTRVSSADPSAPAWLLAICLYDIDALQLLDVSDPRQPKLLPRLVDGEGGYAALGAPSAATFVRAGAQLSLLALVTSETAGRAAGAPGGGLQVVNVDDPSAPRPLAAVARTAGRKPAFPMLAGASGVAALSHGNCTLALVSGFDANGLQLVDLSDASSPKAVGAFAHGAGGALLKAPLAVDIVRVGGVPHAFVTASVNDAVEVLRLNTSAALLSECGA